MARDLERIGSSMSLSLSELISIQKKQQGIVNRDLAQGISYYITNHMDELPCQYIVERDSNGGEYHQVRINIISDKELFRLRDIERQVSYYNRPKDFKQEYQCEWIGNNKEGLDD